jgi:MtN3 and saliva related transmembrane protein
MEFTGIIAGIFTLITYIPQALKTIRTKQTRDLSLTTYVLLIVSAFLWVAYGIDKNASSIWITNTIVGSLGIIILVIKLRS